MLRDCASAEQVADRVMRLRDPATWGFFRRGAIVQTAAPIARAGRIAGIQMRFEDFVACNRDQKLFPHLSEACAAIFAVKHVKYDGHDLSPRLIIAVSTLMEYKL
jgi:hypothetical protein